MNRDKIKLTAKAFLLTALCTATSFAQPVNRKNIDLGWRYFRGDASGAELAAFDDSGWRTVNLPHDASIEGPFDENMAGGVQNGFRPQGKGWYRKRLELPEQLEGKLVTIHFEGVYNNSDVWINGHHLGLKHNGYLDFFYDLTPHLNKSGENILAVRYDNSVPESSRWYTGEGIYRHVWLTISDKLRVANHGTYITTPKITPACTTVKIETFVENHNAERKDCVLLTEVFDPSGKKVAIATACAPIAPGETYRFVQELKVDNPQLWSCETPNLYRAVSKPGDSPASEYATVFGIREIRMTPDQGLLVNGKKVVAKGINIHHDNGCLGAAAFDRAIERRLEVIKDMGCNAVRLSHNPHAPAVLDLCDRMGILVFDEAFDKWSGQFNAGHAPFEETWRGDLDAFLKRDRNHPSVFIWSVGNEVSQQLISNPDENFGVGLMRDLTDFVHKHEPTRKVTCGLFPARENGIRVFREPEAARAARPAQIAFYMDVVSRNYTEHLFEMDHKKYPQMIFLASEVRTVGMNPWFRYDQNYVVGQFYWGGIDYLGESWGWPSKGWIRGLIDLAGTRKPLSYYAESTYTDKPMVHIAIYSPTPTQEEQWNSIKPRLAPWRSMFSHWNWEGVKKLRLATYTNCDSVELLLNGRSLGVKKLADCPEMLMEWDVPFDPGHLRAVARNQGKIVAEHELKTAGPAKKIMLIPDRKTILANGQGLCHLTALVTDHEGNIVPNAPHKITFEVAGAGQNIGVDNGDLHSNEPYVAKSRTVHNGRVLLVVRSTTTPGEIRVSATAKGLPPASTVIKSLQVP